MTSAVQTALMVRRDRFRIEKQNETESAFWVKKRDICLPFRFLLDRAIALWRRLPSLHKFLETA